MLNEESDTAGSERAKAVARIYLEAAKAIAAKRFILVQDSPPELSATQILSMHILHFLSNIFKAIILFQFGRRFPVSRLPEKWRSRFQTVDSDAFLDVDCSAGGVTIKKSNIMHWSVGHDVFPARPIGKKGTIKFYYGSLVYKYLTRLQ